MPSEEFEQLMKQIPKLTLTERARLQEVLRTADAETPSSEPMTEEAFLEHMEHLGKITRRKRRGPIPDREPIKIPGRPLSEDIIEGRGPR